MRADMFKRLLQRALHRSGSVFLQAGLRDGTLGQQQVRGHVRATLPERGLHRAQHVHLPPRIRAGRDQPVQVPCSLPQRLSQRSLLGAKHVLVQCWIHQGPQLEGKSSVCEARVRQRVDDTTTTGEERYFALLHV
uniref:(northern house mosquito) hypothetical protein n=1 Tax=Culex pipiens TaxID=7175 RepID=A0A8D8CBU2_CULPI